MTTALQIVRKASFKQIPWKNGGGITHEAIRVPAAGDSFLWRVSVAYIESSGPFSDFAGYRRNMVLLRGRGLTLTFDTGENCRLRKIGDSAEFDGAVATHCELLDGPCVDLNFMVSKSIRADARVLRLDGVISTRESSLGSALIFSVEAPLLLESDGLEPVILEPWDLAVVSQSSARLSRIEPAESATPSAVFFATINH
ncbi:MAG: HutD family protein [Pseudomonadota bacterium]|nr:HutD family protein [Pseudomonadota bacterium]